MKNLRIVFMGTPDFAVATLKTLVNANYTIVGVVTAPDRPSGRGQKLSESAVKQYAKTNGLLVLQPTNLKSDMFLDELKALNANLQIVVAFRMLPKAVWQMPKYGTFNLHASLLPNYRGAAPINWAIINGETNTGVTTFFIDDKIDTGAIINREDTTIETDENAGSLHDKLMHLGSKLVLNTVKAIQLGSVTTTVQQENQNLKEAPKLNRDNCKINWDDDIGHIYNKIRGLSPYPAAWSFMENNDETFEVKIYEAEKEVAHHNLTLGSIIVSKKEFKVAVKQGYIKIIKIKLPGKKLMDAVSLLNGYTFKNDAKMR